ncbi:MAG: o-succinylbenzoate synthase [Leptolyngbyaceae cyanobacterium SM1_3_5]|nr:o-succinylbenzoate synthase [Leptolyngbyaceae cyanobacterium SM1_3_5]
MRLKFRLYSRPFRLPLRTHHGVWRQREGVLLQIQDEFDRVSYGEIAPIPWFGSESIERAIEFCHSLPAEFEAAKIAEIPDSLPACQFGFESAWRSLDRTVTLEKNLPYCGLLPTGSSAIAALPFLTKTYSTLKWKIAVESIEEELESLEYLLANLPKTTRLRLDANGGLDFETAQRWLEVCDRSPQIEFLEQPLPVDRFSEMLKLSQNFSTAIALDESVATIAQLQAVHAQGWRGIYVVKAAIAGFPSQLREFIQTHQLHVVWSSALETAIARRFIETHLVEPSAFALGMGVDHLFADSHLLQMRSIALMMNRYGKKFSERLAATRRQAADGQCCS